MRPRSCQPPGEWDTRRSYLRPRRPVSRPGTTERTGALAATRRHLLGQAGQVGEAGREADRHHRRGRAPSGASITRRRRVPPASAATLGRVRAVEGRRDAHHRTNRRDPFVALRPPRSRHRHRRHQLGEPLPHGVESSPSPGFQGHQRRCSPPATTSRRHHLAQPTLAHRVPASRRAAAASSTPMSRAQSPRSRISPTGTERVHTLPTVSGRRQRRRGHLDAVRLERRHCRLAAMLARRSGVPVQAERVDVHLQRRRVGALDRPLPRARPRACAPRPRRIVVDRPGHLA